MADPTRGKAATIEMLRRSIAAVPSRSGGTSPPSTASPVDKPDRSAASHRGSTERPNRIETLPVPAPVAELLPHGGLARGSTVHLTGAASLHVGLVASVTSNGGWATVIGHPRFGLLAAAEMGADLRRCAFIPDPGTDPVAIAAVLIEGIDLVVLDLAGADIPPSRARAVTARVRRHGTVLLVTGGRWPTVDLHLDARVSNYSGIRGGFGRLTGLTLDVAARARGRQTLRTRIELHGARASVAWTSTHSRASPETLSAAQ